MSMMSTIDVVAERGPDALHHVVVGIDLDTQRSDEGGGKQLDVAERGEIDEVRAELVAPGRSGGDLHGEASSCRSHRGR